MANCETEEVLKRISEAAAERIKRKQAERFAFKEKYGNLGGLAIARAERTLRSNFVIFNAQRGEIGKFRSLLSEVFAEWFEVQRAESRAKLMSEFLADLDRFSHLPPKAKC